MDRLTNSGDTIAIGAASSYQLSRSRTSPRRTMNNAAAVVAMMTRTVAGRIVTAQVRSFAEPLIQPGDSIELDPVEQQQ